MLSRWLLFSTLAVSLTGCTSHPFRASESFENPRRRPVQQPIRMVMQRQPTSATDAAPTVPTDKDSPSSELARSSQVNWEQESTPPSDTLPAARDAQDLQQSVLTEVPTDFTADLGGTPNGSGPTWVDLPTVIDAAVRYFPAVQETLALRDISAGDQLAALGQFDYKLKAMSVAMPLGFYENNRTGLSAEQPLWNGGEITGGYRLGRGDIQPWYQERLTNEGGELALGANIPLLKNRTIDDRRAELLKAEQDVLAVEPLIRQQSLDVALMATQAYWSWLATSAKRAVQQELLRIALVRKSQIERSIELGDRPPAANIDNLRLIATRQTSLINAQRRVEAAAIQLSMFYRDDSGAPVLLGTASSEEFFPEFQVRELNPFAADNEFALQNRPEVQFLANQAERLRIELEQAGNIGLPEVNVVFDIAQDLGAPASSKRDKSPLELESGLVGYWEPLQRKMLGKQQAVRGKLTQLQFKRQLVGDKITAELRDARSALHAAARKYEQTRANAELASQTADLFRRSFQEGDVDLIILNLYEEAEAAAKSDVIDSQTEYLVAQAKYQVAQGEFPR
ncbi:MAG: TolC family protein [Planctomycetaceae bacterium]|nr:TolC family protein [Planctomycetaceae bacterium]